MKYITIYDVKFANGETCKALSFELSAKNVNTAKRMKRAFEDGRDGNLYRQFITSITDVVCRAQGIVRYSRVHRTIVPAQNTLNVVA